MRVLHVSEVEIGGVMTHLRHILPRLQFGGVENALILPAVADSAAEDAVERFRSSGTPVFRVRMSRSHGPVDTRAMLGIRRVVDEFGAELLHTHSTFAGLWGRLGIAAGRRQVGAVHSPHAFAVDRYSDCLRRGAIVAAERALACRTDAYALVSGGEAEVGRRVYRLPEHKLVVIPNGLPDEFAATLLSRAEARRRLEIPAHETALLFAGRLEVQKGPDLLVRAMPYLSRMPLVVFADTGSMEEQLKAELDRQGCARRCRFAGGIPNLHECLQAFDAVLAPSRWEGLPYIVLEALSADVPVIASDIPGMHPDEPLARRMTFVPPENPDRLAEAINEIIAGADPASPSPSARAPGPLPPPYRLAQQAGDLMRLYDKTVRSRSLPGKEPPHNRSCGNL